ncbi:MAG: 2Fe-2S iron-sulfur cluster-binding protein, partial [Planctomycetota bacterium]
MKKTHTTYKITFEPSQKSIEIPLQSGKANLNILQAAQKAGVEIRSTCGGEGNCEKCKVIIKSGEVTEKRKA